MVLSIGSDMDPRAIWMLKFDIGIELFSRTRASQLDTDPCAIRTGRLVRQYSGSGRVSRFPQTPVRESKKLKTPFISELYSEFDYV